MKQNNTKDLKVGDIVQHNRGWIGRIREVEYNELDECEIEWWGKEANTVTPRTSIEYLTLITVVV